MVPGEITIYDTQFRETVLIDVSTPITKGEPKWSNYIRGVLAGFQDRGVKLPALDVAFMSTVPLGGGLSSSAALEVCTATLMEAATGKKIDPVEKALLAQKAEHDFAGVPCGIMDQFISVLGREGHLLLLDCRTRKTELVPMHDPSVTLLSINTNVKHELGSGEYAKRRTECESAAKVLGIASLRDATVAQLEKLKGKAVAAVSVAGLAQNFLNAGAAVGLAARLMQKLHNFCVRSSVASPLRSCPDDAGDHGLSFANTPSNMPADTFSLDGIVITDHNHAMADTLVNGTVNNVKGIGWNGLNGGFRLSDNTTVSNVFLRCGDDSLMMWGTNVTVRNATVWQTYNGGVVNLGWGAGSAGDGCLIDGLYVVKTDWLIPNSPGFTKPHLDGQNDAVIASLMVPGTMYGTVNTPVFRNILVEDPPNVLLSLKIVFPECNDPGSPRDNDCTPVDLTLPSVMNLIIENLCTPAAIQSNSIGFLNIPAGFTNELPSGTNYIFPTNYTLHGSMNIGLTNVIIQSMNGTVNPLTSANVAAVAGLITNGANINLSFGFNPDPCLSCLPQLAIMASRTNAILTWPTNFPAFSLESTTNLASPTVWQTNPTAPAVIGGLNVVTNPTFSTHQFYRLIQ